MGELDRRIGSPASAQFDVPTLEEAKAALAAEKQKVEEAIKFGKPLPSEDSFEAFAGEFLKYQEKRISPQVAKGKLSQEEYVRQKGIVKKHLKPFFGEVKLAAIRRSDVVRYMHKRTGEVSDGTIIKEINVMKRLFNVALDSRRSRSIRHNVRRFPRRQRVASAGSRMMSCTES